MTNLKGSLFLLLAALIWGLAFVAQSSAMNNIGPYLFNLSRSILAIVTLSPLLIKSLKKCDKDVIKKSIVAGLICGFPMALGTTFQQMGLVQTSPGKAGFITALYILIVPLLGLFAGKRISLKVTFALLLSVVGFYLLCLGDSFTLNKYDLYVVCCSISFAVQIVFIDRFAENTDTAIMSCSQFLIGAIVSVFFIVATKEDVKFEYIKDGLIPILYAGILSSGAADTLQIIGQKNCDPTIAGLIMSLESVFSAIFGFIILKSQLSLKELSGCILIFIAVILCELPEKKKEN